MRSDTLAFAVAVLAAAAAGSVATAQTLIVGNKAADTAGFVDLRAGEMVTTRPTGGGPHEVAISPDGRTAAVVAYGGQGAPGRTVHLYEAATAAPIKTIDLGEHTRPHGIAWLPGGRRFVATTEGSGHLVIVDAEAGEVIGAIATGEPGSHMVALAPDGGRAYVANLGSASFSVIDLADRRRLATVPAEEGSEGIAVTPDGAEIWVSNREADSVLVFDAETLARKTEIATGSFPIRVAISPDGTHAVVSNAREGSLTVIDVRSKEVIRTVALEASDGGNGVPVTVLFHPDGDRLFAALTRAAEIAIVDTGDWRQTGRIAAGEGSDGLGYSPLRLQPSD